VKIKTYKTIHLPVVSYGYEISSLTLRGDHRSEVFENRVLRRILEPKRYEIIGGLEKLHNNLCSLPDIIRMIKSKGEFRSAGKKRNAYRVFLKTLKERDH
jgi:hypothetical protein